MTRIDETVRRGNVSYGVDFAIGHHDCDCCGIETPSPPQSLLNKLARQGANGSTIWPFAEWTPEGWISIGDYGHVCDRCARAVMGLLGRRKGDATAKDPERAAREVKDFAILETALREAMRLVERGLSREFPPAPIFNQRSRYNSPTHKTVYERSEDCREGEFRYLLRQINNVLHGKAHNHGEES